MTQTLFTTSDFDSLKTILKTHTPKRVLVVHGKHSYEKSSAKDFINNLLGGATYAEFDDFSSNPKWEDMINGLRVVSNTNPELIIAIGGGSVLDMAKMLSVFAFINPKDNYLSSTTSYSFERKIPVLAIPTTAGSGSEATQFAVVYQDITKYSIDHPMLLPDMVFLSAQFSATTSPYLTGISGLDAFSQAMESIWSINSNSESEKFAIEALELVWNNIEEAVNSDFSAKEKMQKAAYLAGKAINITRTTAPHALSYAFTTFYRIPHGHAVALSLPFFLNYNYSVSAEDCTDPRGPEAVRNRMDKILYVMGCGIDEAAPVLKKFFDALGVEIFLPRLIPHLKRDLIATNVNIQRLNNNPRRVTQQAITDFLNQ